MKIDAVQMEKCQTSFFLSSSLVTFSTILKVLTTFPLLFLIHIRSSILLTHILIIVIISFHFTSSLHFFSHYKPIFLSHFLPFLFSYISFLSSLPYLFPSTFLPLLLNSFSNTTIVFTCTTVRRKGRDVLQLSIDCIAEYMK